MSTLKMLKKIENSPTATGTSGNVSLPSTITGVAGSPPKKPMTQVSTVCHSRIPDAPSPMTMPMVAEDEWIIAVMSAAMRAQETTPKKVEESRPDMTSMTAGRLRSGLRPPVIRLMP